MYNNNFMNLSIKGLHDTSSSLPENDILVMGFTMAQAAPFCKNGKKMTLFQVVAMTKKNSPRLAWFDAKEQKFYDLGDATKTPKNKFNSIKAENVNRSHPVRMKYYIPMTTELVKESDKPIDPSSIVEQAKNARKE